MAGDGEAPVSSTAAAAGGYQAVHLQVDDLADSLEVKLTIDKSGTTKKKVVKERSQKKEASASGEEAEPWKEPRFAQIQWATKDLWDMSVPGWAVRVHRSERCRPFHPVHRSTPFDIQDLDPRRITKLCGGEEVEIYQDEWTDPKNTMKLGSRKDGTAWRGYTFFKLKTTGNSESCRSSEQKAQSSKKKSEVDSEFEFIDSD